MEYMLFCLCLLLSKLVTITGMFPDQKQGDIIKTLLSAAGNPISKHIHKRDKKDEEAQIRTKDVKHTNHHLLIPSSEWFRFNHSGGQSPKGCPVRSTDS